MPAFTLRRMFRRDRAEVGVGTLIIFIAMVLVAAVAAAVIIGTSGSLQQRAQATGKEATADVSSNLKVLSVYGERADAASDVSIITLSVSLSAGAPPMDLSETLLRYSDGGDPTIYAFGDPTTPFTLTWIRGSGTSNVIEPGDLVELDLELATELAPRSDFRLQLIHAIGAPAELELKTPPTYSDNLYLDMQ